MSDTRLRDLERRWRETGAVEDEAVYIHERLRAGELCAAIVYAAATLDYAPAQIVTAASPVGRPVSFFDSPLFCSDVLSLNRATLLRAILLVLSRFYDERSLNSMPDDGWYALDMDRLARSFLVDPSSIPEHHIRDGRYSIDILLCEPWPLDPAHVALRVLNRFATFLGSAMMTDDLYGVALQFGGSLQDHKGMFSWLNEAEIKATLRRGLVPWLLGYADPLLDRS